MALSNVLMLSQIAGYVIALILSLCILIPMSLHHKDFNGQCLLFSNGTWQEKDGQFVADWASGSNCMYTIAMGVITLLVSLIQIYRISISAYQGNDSPFISVLIDVVISLGISAMSFIAALIITLGFIVWCQNMTQRFPSCEIAAGQDIMKSDNIDTVGFYIQLGTAQFGAWGSFACWVGLCVFAMLKLCRYHELENMRASMFRERQRVVFDEDKKDSPSGSGVDETGDDKILIANQE
uniref:Putative transmembrane protein n=1 Tax=Xenopsylla cheopis TaxID=163159 RepID=A0A6M2DXX0_XENCH